MATLVGTVSGGYLVAGIRFGAPAGVTVTESGGSTNVTVGGATDTYTVVLNSLPTANVTLTMTFPAELNLVPTTLTFTPAKWNVPQTVTVSGVHTAIETPTALITHKAVSADPFYNGIAVASVLVIFTDPNPPKTTTTGNGEGSYPLSNGPHGPGEGGFGFGGLTGSLRVAGQPTLYLRRSASAPSRPQPRLALLGPFLQMPGGGTTLVRPGLGNAPGTHMVVLNASRPPAPAQPDADSGAGLGLVMVGVSLAFVLGLLTLLYKRA